MEEIPDTQLRIWALDTAAAVNRKGTDAKEVINDAELYYGFLIRSDSDNIIDMRRRNETESS